MNRFDIDIHIYTRIQVYTSYASAAQSSGGRGGGGSSPYRRGSDVGVAVSGVEEGCGVEESMSGLGDGGGSAGRRDGMKEPLLSSHA